MPNHESLFLYITFHFGANCNVHCTAMLYGAGT